MKGGSGMDAMTVIIAVVFALLLVGGSIISFRH